MRRLARARFPEFPRVRSWPFSLERRGPRSSRESASLQAVLTGALRLTLRTLSPWYWGPVWRATGSCMKGPASDLNVSDFIAKADARAAAGDIDPLKNLSRQKIYLFHGYNDALVARAATDAAADFCQASLSCPATSGSL